MELPAISLPNIELPFDIPVLLHPPVDHFAIALPVVILLLELINLVIKRRSLSMVSLFLMVVATLAIAAAYLTGSVDGKEAFDALSEAGQAELKGHKLLGTYLLIATAIVLLFKLLSMMLGRTWSKTLYMLLLIALVAGLFKQGEEGGELVYEYGANVERVKTLDDKLFDCEEALEEAAPQTDEDSETETTPKVEQAPQTDAPSEVKIPDTNATDANQTQPLPAVVLPPVANTHEVEGMPEPMVQPKIATH